MSVVPDLFPEAGCCHREPHGTAEDRQEGSDESSPSFQGLDINQINYGAATVSQPWRGNEMIRGNDAERVNEIIN